jgi:hypothetical protein
MGYKMEYGVEMDVFCWDNHRRQIKNLRNGGFSLEKSSNTYYESQPKV